MNANEMLKEVMRLEREGKTKEAIELNEKLELKASQDLHNIKNKCSHYIYELHKIRNQVRRAY